VRRSTYDSLSRLLTAKNPESGTVTWSYDSDSKVLTKTDARGIAITYGYDALDRVTGKTYSNNDAPVTYFYDQISYNGLAIANGVGRQTGMADASGQTAWSFDVMGRALSERRTIQGVTKSVGYSYNLDGSVATVAYPSGRVIRRVAHPNPEGAPSFALVAKGGVEDSVVPAGLGMDAMFARPQRPQVSFFSPPFATSARRLRSGPAKDGAPARLFCFRDILSRERWATRRWGSTGLPLRPLTMRWSRPASRSSQLGRTR